MQRLLDRGSLSVGALASVLQHQRLAEASVSAHVWENRLQLSPCPFCQPASGQLRSGGGMCTC